MQQNHEFKSLEKQLESVERQNGVLEQTSSGLAGQVSYLKSKLAVAEKQLTDATSDLQTSKVKMQNRNTVMESLSQEHQNLSRENCRLLKDKSNLEAHVRQLTSILQAVYLSNPSQIQYSNSNTSEQAGVQIENVNIAPAEGPSENGSRNRKSETDGKKEEDVQSFAPRKPLASLNNDTPAQIERSFSFVHEIPEKKNNENKPNHGETENLDKQLLDLNVEREKLEIELSRMPQNSVGRTVSQRRRRRIVEARLEELSVDISKIKRNLRRMRML